MNSAAPGTICAAGLILRACDLPSLIADDDGRGRMVGLRQLAKNWAVADDHKRIRMIERAPKRLEWSHRFGPRRYDLARIAAVVAALCDRDNVPEPSWVARHRSRQPITLTLPSFLPTPWNDHIRHNAPAACARHNVWFMHVDIDDYRIHGFR